MELQTFSNKGFLCVCISDNMFSVGTAEASEMYSNQPNEYFFNRLFVKKNYRNKGFGRLILNRFVEECDKRGITLLLTINSYGDLSFEKLKEMYLNVGFEQIENNYFIRKAIT